jgi:type III restriction enzyme
VGDDAADCGSVGTAETIIFLTEGRRDFLQSTAVPLDEPSDAQPGSTSDVDYWTSKDVREVLRSHLNYVVADTKKWEQSAAYILDTHPLVESFVKNAGLGFAIPYFHNGKTHDYQPDFIARLRGGEYVIVETNGFDELAEVKAAAAERWVGAVNADRGFGTWRFTMARSAGAVREFLGALPVGRTM